MFKRQISSKKRSQWKVITGVLIAVALLFSAAAISGKAAAPEAKASSIHPTFPFLDADGVNVLESQQAASTMKTCGTCHNTDFIAHNSFHANVGADDLSAAGETNSERLWDTSSGLYGKWNPITYRYLSPYGDLLIDLDTQEWIKTLGLRHAGGGPVEELIEMNCFLCHFEDPANDARIEELISGDFEWANTATLANSGIINNSAGNWSWNEIAFDEQGEIKTEYLAIQDPSNENCNVCHGLVHDAKSPLTIDSELPWNTLTTGQIVSSQKIFDSGLNLTNKDDLSRSWDIHAERVLSCTDCHFSLNNPLNAQQSEEISHLIYDPRGPEIGEYLEKPLHQFARGQSAQGSVSPEYKDTMRRCEGCHDAYVGHTWLPYQDRHFSAVSCESCHIPQLYAPALQQVDWTVLTIDGDGLQTFRGIEGELGDSTSIISGYIPTLMLRENVSGDETLAPYNLVSSWVWIYGEPARPVRLEDLKAVYLDGNSHATEILEVFDADGNGVLSDNELRIDSEAKEIFIKTRLEALGLENPRIFAEVQPYSINHDVTNGDWANRDCRACHSDTSRLTTEFSLAEYVPGGVMPEFAKGNNVIASGEMRIEADGELVYEPMPQAGELYIIGHDSVSWIDWFGIVSFLGVLGGTSIHGGLRFFLSMRRGKTEQKTKRVYMYGVYERFWHWLQTFAILLLTFTGLVIHKPAMFGIFSFPYMVAIHNILGFILALNAALSLFYHLASGEIKQYIPQPRGFFNGMIKQSMFYLKGIFNDEKHPYEKTTKQKLNPLQQFVYVMTLNILLPLQVITGVLIWGAQRWPNIASMLGGLDFLAPFHTLIAWSFSSFIVMHVYMTTTGHTPLAGISAMITGWDELEIHEHTKESE